MLLTRVRARSRLRAIVLLCFGGTLSSLFLMAPPVWGQEGDALDVSMMRRALGMSGLRRSIALDTPLGALLMRNNTYRIAKLSLAAVPAGDRKFSSSSAIGQFNSVLDIGHSGDTAFFLQTTARHVDFEVSDLLKASVKRLDLGIIAMRNSSAGNPQYLGLSVITEDNTGRPQFVDGYRIGDGVGLRLEGGAKISDAWAVSFRSEFLNWQGENGMNRPNLMPQPMVNPIDNGRMFSNVDIIRAANAFGGRGQWRTGLHYLSNQYEPQQNNFGMTVTEPFGDHERLGFFRTGYLQMWPLASIPGAMAYVEANIDREFENNMDQFLSDKTIVSAKVGVNWTFAPSRQLLLEWQRFNGTEGIRSRNGLLMTILLDDL
jgi:hypothetical protein